MTTTCRYVAERSFYLESVHVGGCYRDTLVPLQRFGV